MKIKSTKVFDVVLHSTELDSTKILWLEIDANGVHRFVKSGFDYANKATGNGSNVYNAPEVRALKGNKDKVECVV